MTLLPSDTRLETERLVLRRIEPDDFPFFARIHADPDVARYLSHGNPRTTDESRAWLDSILASYAATTLGQLAVTRRDDGALIGRCGLSGLEMSALADGVRTGFYFPQQAPEGSIEETNSELGYTLDAAHWGQGYASEAVTAVFQYGRKNRPSEIISSLIHPDNVRSRRLAGRFGVRHVDDVNLWGRTFNRYLWP